MRKIIFLDIDGTINSIPMQAGARQHYKIKDEFGNMFTEEPVKWLNYIIEQTNADIVMISAWSYQFRVDDGSGHESYDNADLEKLSRFAKNRGLPDKFIGLCRDWDRVRDIQEWLDKNLQGQEYRYCWLDDESSFNNIHKECVVKPYHGTALTEADAMKVIEILNR